MCVYKHTQPDIPLCRCAYPDRCAYVLSPIYPRANVPIQTDVPTYPARYILMPMYLYGLMCPHSQSDVPTYSARCTLVPCTYRRMCPHTQICPRTVVPTCRCVYVLNQLCPRRDHRWIRLRFFCFFCYGYVRVRFGTWAYQSLGTSVRTSLCPFRII